MNEREISTVLLSIFGGGGGLLAIGAFLRDYFKGRLLTDANRDAAINGVGINQQVLNNLVDEIERMKVREIETLKKTELRESEAAKRTESREVEIESRAKARELDIEARAEAREKELQDQIVELRERIDELEGKLAGVRMVAIDCYALAMQCVCPDDGKQMLLTHLKTIIRDA